MVKVWKQHMLKLCSPMSLFCSKQLYNQTSYHFKGIDFNPMNDVDRLKLWEKWTDKTSLLCKTLDVCKNDVII
jgi:hypothetical protein